MVWLEAKAPIVHIRFDRQTVRYTLAELPTRALAYCCTAHRSHGSDYATVVMAIDRTYTVPLDHTLLYTAITRAHDAFGR